MPSLLQRALARREPEERAAYSLEDYAQLFDQFTFGGLSYSYSLGAAGISQTLTGQTTEWAPKNFAGLVAGAYESNGIVFACMMVRQLIFSGIRFRWQRIRDGKPSDYFGGPELRILDRPWQNGTTQDLLSRMIQDADIAGNSYWVVVDGELVRLRPDWVDIVLEPRLMPDGRGQVGWKLAGYLFTTGGVATGSDTVAFLPNEVAHFCPLPDPMASYRGMSWLTPILKEIGADQAMTRFQQSYLTHGATPNMVIKHAQGATEDKIKRFAEIMADRFGGPHNAGKTLHMYPGADASVVGSNMKTIDFANVRNGGEARIAAAAGVPPIIAGFIPGLESGTYSNYGQARRRLADGTARPLWQNLCGCLQSLLPTPRSVRGDVRLWFDTSDVAFLREDEKDAADIQSTRAATIASLITSGFKWNSAVEAVLSDDFGVLDHTELYSVQLQPAGNQQQQPELPTSMPQQMLEQGQGNGSGQAN